MNLQQWMETLEKIPAPAFEGGRLPDWVLTIAKESFEVGRQSKTLEMLEGLKEAERLLGHIPGGGENQMAAELKGHMQGTLLPSLFEDKREEEDRKRHNDAFDLFFFKGQTDRAEEIWRTLDGSMNEGQAAARLNLRLLQLDRVLKDKTVTVNEAVLKADEHRRVFVDRCREFSRCRRP